MAETKLEARYSSQASFYGKATVDTINTGDFEKTMLFSYGSRVAETDYIETEIGMHKVIILNPLWDCSQTTFRHIREFIMQNSDCYVWSNTSKQNIKKFLHELEDGSDGRLYLIA